MSEWSRHPETDIPEVEAVEKRKERLRPVLERSLKVFRNPEADLRNGSLVIRRRNDKGQEQEIAGLVAMDVGDSEVELGMLEDDGGIGASGFMDWQDIMDARPAAEADVDK